MNSVIEVPDTMQPGIYPEMDPETYHALPAVSASRLEKLRKSPLQYQHALTAEPVTSPVMERGTALHMAVLESARFRDHYTVIGQCEGVKRDGNRCNNLGNVIRRGCSFCGVHDPSKGTPADAGIAMISQQDYDSVLGMRDAIAAHPRAKKLFEGKGAFETSIVFHDHETGAVCKIRPDRLVERAGLLIDIKTAKDASPRGFERTAEFWGYWRRIAFYRRGLRAVGWPFGQAALLAIEPEPPHDLGVYLMDTVDLDKADAEVSGLLRVLRACELADHWPGYGEEFQLLRRPSWARDEIE